MAEPILIPVNEPSEFDVSLQNILDAKGKPTRFDGAPVWTPSDPTIADVRLSEDGLVGTIGTFEGVEGTATITIEADGKHGAEVTPHIAVITVIVAASDVSTFDVAVGEVRPRAAV